LTGYDVGLHPPFTLVHRGEACNTGTAPEISLADFFYATQES